MLLANLRYALQCRRTSLHLAERITAPRYAGKLRPQMILAIEYGSRQPLKAVVAARRDIVDGLVARARPRHPTKP